MAFDVLRTGRKEMVGQRHHRTPGHVVDRQCHDSLRRQREMNHRGCVEGVRIVALKGAGLLCAKAGLMAAPTGSEEAGTGENKQLR